MNAMTQTTAPVSVKGDTHPALSQLRDPRLLREMAYIDGRWTAAGDARFEVNDPATGLTVARVSRLGAEAAGQAVDAAARALPDWKALLPQERAERLRAWHALILDALEDLALIMTLEQGKSLAESRGEIAYAASFVEWYSEEAKRLNVESVTSHLPGAEMLVRREALGVAALLTP
jgi:aspartate-semialdehyde dehydrogenase